MIRFISSLALVRKGVVRRCELCLSSQIGWWWLKSPELVPVVRVERLGY